MALIKKLVDKIKSGVSRAVWKGIKHAGTAVAGGAAALLVNKLGYHLSDVHQAAIAVAVTGFLGSALKMAKDRFPSQLGWL